MRPHERFHGRASGGAVGVVGGELGNEPLADHPRFEQLGVGGAGQVEVQRRCTTEAGWVDGADDRATPGAAANRDQALNLEHPQPLTQRLSADAVLLEHGRLRREVVALAKPANDDVVDNVAGNAFGCLQGSQR